jgi:hypothetical protein
LPFFLTYYKKSQKHLKITTDRKNMESPSIKELTIAIIKAKKDGVGGICLTNNDPKADWAAVTEKNRKVLSKYDIEVIEHIDKQKNGYIRIETILRHKKSEQYIKSENILKQDKYGRPLETTSPGIFMIRRMAYEGLLGIASSNDAIEAELFGPERKHRLLTPSYDKTAEFIYTEYTDHNGEVFTKKTDRKKFERSFLGMTTEEENKIEKFEKPKFNSFSWNDIKLFLQCPRCFYNAKKFRIKPPTFDTESFALPKAVDILLKKEFSQYRKSRKPHPIMSKIGNILPLRHKKLKKWQTAWSYEEKMIGGIQYKDAWGNWLAYGGIDDVWINEKKEIVIVEYKTISQRNVNSSGSNIKYLKRAQQQLEFYAWLFKKNNYTVCSTGYLLFYNALTDKDALNGKLEFEPHLIPHEIDDSWVQDIINGALRCLEKDVPATATTNCRACKYFNALTNRAKQTTSHKGHKNAKY